MSRRSSDMLKGVFFSFPIKSVQNTLMPVIDQLGNTGFDMYYYDTTGSKPSGNFTFNAYSESFSDYNEKLNGNTSYFEFGNILIDATKSIIQHLIAEVGSIKPDFIIYSHLAPWGKLIARYYGLPAIALNTTFILDKRIMLPYFRSINKNGSKIDTVADAVAFYRKSESLSSGLGIKELADPWDIYVNKGDLNIAFIFEELQPQRHLFGNEYKFPGYPYTPGSEQRERNMIYFSMGTVFNSDMRIFRECINGLKLLNMPAVLSAGSRVDIDELRRSNDYPQLEIVPFTDQKKVLANSRLFITHGGMASVHEAIYSHTPMIIIPVTPEQQITARRIAELGIGRYIFPGELSQHSFQSAATEILSHQDQHTKKLMAMSGRVSPGLPACSATEIIHEYLHTQQ